MRALTATAMRRGTSRDSVEVMAFTVPEMKLAGVFARSS